MRKLDEFYTNIEKETVTLECEVNKDNIKCVWRMYGQGHIIEPNERFIIESIGRVQRLTVSNLNLDDQQNIACNACKNGEEIVSTSGRIIVNCKYFLKLILIIISKKFTIYLNKRWSIRNRKRLRRHIIE